MVIAQLLALPHITKHSSGGKDPNVRTPALPPHCWDNQKVIALHLSPAIRGGGGGGGVVTNDLCITTIKSTKNK